jgi:hypothetical protein
MEFESTIKGGLPVIVEYSIQPAEPDVGFERDYIDDFVVKWTSGHEIKFDIPESDMDRLYDEAFDDYMEQCQFERCLTKYGDRCYDMW